MKFVLLTYVGEQGLDEWNAMSAEERRAYVADHNAWFARWGQHVRGGEELGAATAARTVLRQGGHVTVTDGPYIESKELLGGFIVAEADGSEQAVEMARAWLALGTDGNRVEVWPVGDSAAEADAGSGG